MTTLLEALQSQALIYKDQQIRDLVTMVQTLYENCTETASIATLTDAYHLLNLHGCDVEYFASEELMCPKAYSQIFRSVEKD